jgi:hypothetical protein
MLFSLKTIPKKRKLTLQLEHNTRKTLEKSFACDNRRLSFLLLQAAKFPLNPTLRGFTDGPHKFQLSESDTELRRSNEHTCELITHNKRNKSQRTEL